MICMYVTYVYVLCISISAFMPTVWAVSCFMHTGDFTEVSGTFVAAVCVGSDLFHITVPSSGTPAPPPWVGEELRGICAIFDTKHVRTWVVWGGVRMWDSNYPSSTSTKLARHCNRITYTWLWKQVWC